MKNKRIYIYISVITILISAIPLFTFNCIGGHDIAYHLLRIEALKTGILSGHPFLRVNELFFGGQGYASSMFYPDFLLYFPALLRCMGTSINISYHMFIAACMAAGFASAYFCMNKMTGSDQKAAMFAIIFTLYQYHIDDVYTRSAVGEFTAYIFIPFIIYGIYDLVMKGFKKPYMTAIGFTGIILCHTLTAFISAGVFALAFIMAAFISVKRGKEDRIRFAGTFLSLMLTAAGVLCVTAFYWVPMLEQMRSAVLQYTKTSFDLNYGRMIFRDIFLNAFPGMGIAVFLLCIPRIFVTDRNEDIKLADLMLILGVLLTLATTGLLPWARLQGHLSFVQFPWRLFQMSGPFIAAAAAVYVDENWKDSRAAILAVLMIMAVSFTGNIERNDQKYYSYSDDYFSYAPYTAEVIGGEWLPETVTDRDEACETAGEAFDDKGVKTDVVRTGNELSVQVSGGDTGYIDVPFIYYRGYASSDQKGQALKTDGSGENGRCRVYLNPDTTGVRVYYKGTVWQLVSSLISAVAVCLIAAYYIFRGQNSLRHGGKND